MKTHRTTLHLFNENTFSFSTRLIMVRIHVYVTSTEKGISCQVTFDVTITGLELTKTANNSYRRTLKRVIAKFDRDMHT